MYDYLVVGAGLFGA
ncbi:hypothetical protein CGSSp23BS72_11975 [Streptococcus pneumoniae SP23-BS72]|nr:hypothetical protein CGSSp23BS72_11975 [Streptococcus pneumoniae SP23-BS72]